MRSPRWPAGRQNRTKACQRLICSASACVNRAKVVAFRVGSADDSKGEAATSPGWPRNSKCRDVALSHVNGMWLQSQGLQQVRAGADLSLAPTGILDIFLVPTITNG